MASPRPMAVVRLRAKMDTSVNDVTTRRTRKVPTTASAPTASGSPAATTEPNTRTRRITVIGKVSSSAFFRSFSAWASIWLKTSPAPPTSTLMGPVAPA